MKKGDILEGVIGQVDFPNQGKICIDGETATVKNGIPGQRVRFQVTKKRKNKAEGRVLTVLEKSPLEQRGPLCSIFPACGGCMYQTLPYEEQLRLKERQVKDLLDRAIAGAGQTDGEGHPAYLFEGIKGSPRELGYRNKMEFSFGDEYKDGPLSLGLHRKGSTYDILTASDCKIVHGDMTAILDCVLDWARELEAAAYPGSGTEGRIRETGDACRNSGAVGQDAPTARKEEVRRPEEKTESDNGADQNSDAVRQEGFAARREGAGRAGSGPGRLAYHRMTHQGWLRHLLLRRAESTGEILVCLVTTSQREEDLVPLVARLLALSLAGRIVGILHIINDSAADIVQSDETRLLWGQDSFYETVLGLRFKVTPFSFFQTNTLGAEVLYQTARDYIGDTKDKIIFDLYSGTGTIAQILAPVAKEVVGVEIVEEAVAAARENASGNGLANCRFLAGDVLKVLDSLEESPDFIVLDPPRDGIHPKALPKILRRGADRIVYISCKPTSLARDLDTLIRGGYRVERVCLVDLFCETVHVETVVGLQRKDI